jgi:dipeptidase E
MSRPRQIIAMGGGGFSMEPDNHRLDQYILSAAGISNPKICFVPTASGDAQSYLDRFYAAFQELACVPSHLSLFKPPVADIRSYTLQQDVIYVGGGNTRNMLALWREWGLDAILREAWEAGVVLAGLSAGSICWFEEGLSDSVRAGELHPLPCLGFLLGSHCPHYDGEAERRPRYQALISTGGMAGGFGVDDCAAVHFMGTEPVRAVCSRVGAKAYRVSSQDGRIVEEAMQMIALG